MKVRESLVSAAARLSASSGTARLDAELLMAEALQVSREELLLRQMGAETPAAFAALVERRLAHEPIAYILGRRAFWTIELEVGPGVLVPRPDSETLLEAAIDYFGDRSPETILDLGTGPGTLLLAALDLWPEARGLGVDLSEEALAFARRNADRLRLAERADFQRGDWGDGLDRRFDLVLCNPPYVEDSAALPAGVVDWEPAAALFAGADGLEALRTLAPRLARLLARDGVACLEIGAGQEAAATALFTAHRFTVSSRLDLKGVARCLRLQPNPD